MLVLKTTTKFNKDLKRIKKHGYDIKKLEIIVNKLLKEETLEKKYFDHRLYGYYRGCRECLVGPAIFLKYYIENNILTLIFLNTGAYYDRRKNMIISWNSGYSVKK